MKVKVVLSENKDSVYLYTRKALSFSTLREFVKYSDEHLTLGDGSADIRYTIPLYQANCFVLVCLISKFKDNFICDTLLLNSIKQVASTGTMPTCTNMANHYIGIKCMAIDGYLRLISLLGATSTGIGTYKIPFSRLYDSYKIIEEWKHDFLIPFEIDENLKSLVYDKLSSKGTIEELCSIDVKELFSISKGYQIKMDGLDKLKYENANDILFTRPKRYTDRGAIDKWGSMYFGETGFVKGIIVSTSITMNKKLYLVLEELESGYTININFYGGGYLAKRFSIGDIVTVHCTKIKGGANGIAIYSPDEIRAMPIVPTYKQSTTNKITSTVIMRCVIELFMRFDGRQIGGYIHSKSSIWELLKELHFPKSVNDYLDTIDKLAYIELLYLQLLFLDRKKNENKKGSPKVKTKNVPNYIAPIVQNLPFELTNGQKEAIKTFVEGLKSEESSRFLLSADVGAGKSVTTQITCLYVAECGYQSVMIAPTEILAKQLYEGFLKLVQGLSKKPYVAFLSASTATNEKRAILKGLANGEIDILVGTHSVLNIENFYNLGLIVLDEQQKFGTEQRDRLLSIRDKNGNVPDIISQTATPIPRTTALAFYGDINLVTINEKPKGRKPIITELVENHTSESFLKGIGKGKEWTNILKELQNGKQVFIVAPAVEEDSKIIAVNKIKKFIEKVPDIRAVEVSGKTSKDKQNKIISDFLGEKKYNVLIASSIIEVGIDIPNATVMIIVGADRFGASSLHQIRGRVGRNGEQAYCYLVKDTESEQARARLMALVNSQDGFEIALSDLSTRKEGDILGVRQSGESRLRFCDLVDHGTLIEQAREEAIRIYNSKDRNTALHDAKYFLGIGEKKERKDITEHKREH